MYCLERFKSPTFIHLLVLDFGSYYIGFRV